MAGSDPIVVPLRSKRQKKALALQKLNHAIPAVALLAAGLQAITQGHEGFGFYLGILQLVSAGALIVLTTRELREAFRVGGHGHPGHAHHGIDWVDIAAGFVLVAEVLEHWHLTHHVKRPMLLAAITTFGFGLFQGRLVERRSRTRVLRVEEEGIYVGGRPFKARRLQARWEDVASIDVGPRYAAIATRAGRTRKLDLTDLEDVARLRAALVEAQTRLASTVAAGSEDPAYGSA